MTGGRIAPVATAAVVGIVWEAFVRFRDIPRYLVPAPSDVMNAAVENAAALARASVLTSLGAAAGFTISLVAGMLIAFLLSQSPIIRRSLYPYAIFLQTVPIVAIAPLIIIWFGTGFQSVVVVSFIISLFPIITNTTTGLVNVDEDLLDLFRTCHASRLQTLLKLRLPHTVTYLVAGAKISSGLAVIGAIVGEFFAGYGAEEYGLGYLIIVSSGQLKTPLLFAAIIASAILGLIFFGAIARGGESLLKRERRVE